ncbi:hypothetical protein D3C77_483520 [compost metagenome]
MGEETLPDFGKSFELCCCRFLQRAGPVLGVRLQGCNRLVGEERLKQTVIVVQHGNSRLRIFPTIRISVMNCCLLMIPPVSKLSERLGAANLRYSWIKLESSVSRNAVGTLARRILNQYSQSRFSRTIRPDEDH